jgi:predicted CXXCH cytochrome family protein
VYRRLTAFLLVFCCELTLGATPAEVPGAPWLGAKTCSSCHAAEYRAWRGSHHDLAMQEATAATVLGDFDDASFTYNSITSRFTKRGESFWVSTDGPDGKLQDYRVEYTFGVEPLQQYLLALPGGRLQALNIAWDSRPAEEGGQRWYHLYPEETIGADDPLHWTGPYHNWNTRCAECHSTGLEKNFDADSAEFATTWVELNVACEACHGTGQRHLELVRTGQAGNVPGGGFDAVMGERGRWAFPGGEPIARRLEPLPRSQQVESCGRCHARRGTLGEYRHGRDLLDTHRLSLLTEPLYHPDGQILDEVYVYGSFVQSAMYQAGVVCSNCHDPHSNRLRATGNGVCAQCHAGSRYDTVEHHHHPAGGPGALCVDCHMPETTYMGVDDRRDHSMRIPRPDLSAVVGTPNACNGCHDAQDAQWSLDRLRDWGVHFNDTSRHPARALALARQGDTRVTPALAELAGDGNESAILRATALVQLGEFYNREAYEAARAQLGSDDPLLRMAAVRTLSFLPPQQLLQLLAPLIDDPVTAVRLEVASALAPLDPGGLPPALASRLQSLFEEYLEIQGQHADMPAIQLQLAGFFLARRLPVAAEQAYRRALQINPQLVPGLLNLADLYRQLGREKEARELLLEAIRIAPGQGSGYHALGLLETRAGNSDAALVALQRAAELETAGVRHRYVYAIALHDSGDPGGAIEQLRQLLRSAPENPDILMALVTYNREAGSLEEARRYAARLAELDPRNPAYRQLLESL